MVPRRRTQQERREGTIRKLLDAAVAVLVAKGYAAASVQAICERAGVSQGALFRHFPTREALMVAVGQDVGRQTLERYRRDLARLHAADDLLPRALRLVRDRCRSRINQAWLELTVAARTSPPLRRALRPVAAAYHQDIERLARELLPDLAAALGEKFGLVVSTIVAMLDGETLQRFVLPRPALEDARIEALGALSRVVRSR